MREMLLGDLFHLSEVNYWNDQAPPKNITAHNLAWSSGWFGAEANREQFVWHWYMNELKKEFGLAR